MSDEHLWSKIDNHAMELAEIKQRFAVVDSRLGTFESRLESVMQFKIEERTEVRQGFKEIREELSALRADYLRAEGMRIGEEKAKKDAGSWRERFFSSLPAIVMMLLALGWLNGANTQ